MIPSRSLEQIAASIDSGLGVKTRRVTKMVLDQSLGLMVPGQAPSLRYTTKVVEERTEQWSKLVGILFCMPASKPGKEEILPNLDYFHHRSALFVDFFCVGYEAKNPSDAIDSNKQPVATVNKQQWTFDAAEFNLCRAQLESEIQWRYSGETELLLAVARKVKGSTASLDYTSVVACNLEEMNRDAAFGSIRAFFEKIFQFGEQYKGTDPVWQLSDKFGLSGGGNLLVEAVLSLLPEVLKKQYKASKHFVVKDVSR